MATVLKGQRKQMTPEDLKKDAEQQQKRIDANTATMQRAPQNELGDAVRALGAIGNKRLSASKEEALKMRKPNSRAQYEHERKAGDPNALKLSFEEWKKL